VEPDVAFLQQSEISTSSSTRIKPTARGIILLNFLSGIRKPGIASMACAPQLREHLPSYCRIDNESPQGLSKFNFQFSPEIDSGHFFSFTHYI
jgi:hypothetical protein